MLNKHLLEILQSKIAVLRLELVLMIKSLCCDATLLFYDTAFRFLKALIF